MTGRRSPCPTTAAAMTTVKPKKLQRIAQACDMCHKRSIRCRPSVEQPQMQCQTCHDFSIDCTFRRPSRRRRNPTAAHSLPPNVPAFPLLNAPLPYRPHDCRIAAAPAGGVNSDLTGTYALVREDRPQDLSATAWRSFALASLETTERYLDIYMEIVYPLFPLFHAPTLWSRLRQHEHITDPGFFASVMAACALVGARLRDGATGDRHHFDASPEKSSEIFFAAAEDTILKDLNRARGLGFLRACGLLALTSIQYGQISKMHCFFGHYVTLASMQNFHNEAAWPVDIDVVEREERRRLFWSMYALDIYISVCFDSPMRSQETHASVHYPSEVDDEDLTADVPYPANGEHWLRAWNFTTDLYRVLEHSVKRLQRNKQVREDRISIVRLLIVDGIPEQEVMDNVLGLYHQLPARFKNYSVPLTGNRKEDIDGFQAANIQATLQLVRITLFSINASYDVDQKCSVADQVLTTFHSIPAPYLRAISMPLVYHLGGIGHILASVMEGLLSEESYQRVRALLVSMADLLSYLESGLQPMVGASEGLRNQIAKIDEYMEVQRHLLSSVSLPRDIPTAVGPVPADGFASSSRVDVHPPLEEFQLPPELVNENAWPWPFDMMMHPQ